MRLSELNRENIRVVQPSLSSIDTTKLKVVSTPQQIQEGKSLNYFQRLGSSFSEIRQDITQGIQEGAQGLQDVQKRGSLGNIFTGARDLLRSGLRTAGGVARGAFVPIVEAPGIRQGLEFIGGKITQIPGVEEVVKKATEFSQRNPQLAKDLGNIIDIVTLGGGKAIEAPLKKEIQLVGNDIVRGAESAFKPSEEAVQKNIIEMFNKSIKPTPKKTLTQTGKYEESVVNALKTIKANSQRLNLEDSTGEIVSRVPATINELAQATDQTKKLVFEQYDDLAKQATGAGAKINAQSIADEVSKVTGNQALRLTNPELIKYAENWSERLRDLGAIDTETAQAVVQTLNRNLESFYRNPTYDSASRAAIDAGIANNFRQALDTAIEQSTGKQYQTLKSQYAALKSIERDVVRASLRDGRKNVRGLLDYTDIFTGGQMVTGALSLNPAMFTKGAVERGFKEYIKFLNDPNRAVANLFEQLDIQNTTKFTPKSKTFQALSNPKAGLSIEDVSKRSSIPKDLDPRKYKSAEEFVKAQTSATQYGDYTPALRKYGAEGYTPITKLGVKPDEMITVYRGIDDIKGNLPRKINSGDFVTTDFDSALSYAGNPKDVVSMEVPAKYLSVSEAGDFKTEPFYIGSEYIYTKEIGNPITKSQLTDIWNKANKKKR